MHHDAVMAADRDEHESTRFEGTREFHANAREREVENPGALELLIAGREYLPDGSRRASIANGRPPIDACGEPGEFFLRNTRLRHRNLPTVTAVAKQAQG